MKTIRKISCIAALVSLGGCVTVDIPDTDGKGSVTNPGSLNRAASFSEAMAYLQRARNALRKRARTLEGVDAVTRLGVAAAVAGAGISATLEHHAARRATRFLTIGAVSYMTNRDIAPAAITEVYRAGITNLGCIRTAALSANEEADALRAQIGDGRQIDSNVGQAILHLKADMASIQTLPDSQTATDLATSAQTALTAIANAQTALRGMHKFLNNDGSGERVVSAVDATLQIVNKQALSRTPDVDAIFENGSAFGKFLSTGSGWISDVKTAKTSIISALATATTSTQSDVTTVEALREKFIRDEYDLQEALADLPDLTLSGQLGALDACQMIVGVLNPVTVTPNPISLTAGGDPVKLTLTGKAPFTAHSLPAEVTFDRTANPPTIAASDKAKAADYTITISDSFGVSSDGIPLKIAAKPAASANGGDGSMQGPAAQPAAPAQQQPARGGPPPSPKTDQGKTG